MGGNLDISEKMGGKLDICRCNYIKYIFINFAIAGSLVRSNWTLKLDLDSSKSVKMK